MYINANEPFEFTPYLEEDVFSNFLEKENILTPFLSSEVNRVAQSALSNQNLTSFINFKANDWQPSWLPCCIGSTWWRTLCNPENQQSILVPNELLSLSYHIEAQNKCIIWEGEKNGQTHHFIWIPASINYKNLTINYLIHLAEKDHRQIFIDASIVKRFGGNKITHNNWIMMTNNFLPDNYEEEKLKLFYLSQYRMPNIIEALVVSMAAPLMGKDEKNVISSVTKK